MVGAIVAVGWVVTVLSSSLSDSVSSVDSSVVGSVVVKKVWELSEQIRSSRTGDELSAQINAIVRNATTLR